MSAQRTTFASADTDAVETKLRESFGSVRLNDSAVRMREQLVIGDSFFLGRFDFTGSGGFDVTMPLFMVTTTATGQHRWEVGSERGDATEQPFLIPPGMPMFAELRDIEVASVSFVPDGLERLARAVYADDRLRVRFDSAQPVSAGLGRLYRDVLRYANDNSQLILDSDLVAASLYRHLAVLLLTSFPLHGDRAERRETARGQEEGYRRARAFIDDFASLPITVEDIAQAAHLSTHHLHAAFRAFSPDGGNARQALERARLDAAHQDLVRGDPTLGETVRAIALRWGFTPRRLAELHRRTYGTTPKFTLDR